MSEENKEKTKSPAEGFDKHPENINRKGRPPKGYSITETIRDMMDAEPKLKKALGTKIIELALAGDLAAIKTVWNYMDGMPVQKTDLSIKEKPIPILSDNVPKNDSTQENTEPNQTD